MKDLIIKNGLVYDPLNNIDGIKKEIHIKDGIVVDKVNGDAKVIDASGMIVMPGGVDIHSHIAGTKVNAGRSFRPDDKLEEFNENTLWAAGNNGLPIIDVAGYMKRLRNLKPDKYRSMFIDDIHLNREGQEYVAEYIFNKIKKKVEKSRKKLFFFW